MYWANVVLVLVLILWYAFASYSAHTTPDAAEGLEIQFSTLGAAVVGFIAAKLGLNLKGQGTITARLAASLGTDNLGAGIYCTLHQLVNGICW